MELQNIISKYQFSAIYIFWECVTLISLALLSYILIFQSYLTVYICWTWFDGQMAILAIGPRATDMGHMS